MTCVVADAEADEGGEQDAAKRNLAMAGEAQRKQVIPGQNTVIDQGEQNCRTQSIPWHAVPTLGEIGEFVLLQLVMDRDQRQHEQQRRRPTEYMMQESGSRTLLRLA